MKLPLIGNLFKTAKKDKYSKYLELMPDFKQEKTQKFTTIVLTLLASIVLIIFALNPTLSTISNLQKQLSDNKFVEQKLEEKINNLSILQEKYAEVQPDISIVLDAVPQNPAVVDLVAQVQSVASNTNLTLVGFQTFQVETTPGSVIGKKYSSFDFALSATGDYKSMVIFMNQLVNIQRILTINNLSISKKVNFDTQTLQLSVRGTAYYKE